eukprot:1328753-Rhodomonas_salina.1
MKRREDRNGERKGHGKKRKESRRKKGTRAAADLDHFAVFGDNRREPPQRHHLLTALSYQAQAPIFTSERLSHVKIALCLRRYTPQKKSISTLSSPRQKQRKTSGLSDEKSGRSDLGSDGAVASGEDADHVVVQVGECG